MIIETFEKTALFHGHRCPGLAIGVRAAEEAKRLLEITGENKNDLRCLAESRACYIDALQVLCGCTEGNGKLGYNLTGKAAFSFYCGDRSVRLLLKPFAGNTAKEEQIRQILTAPLEEIFSVGEVRVRFPEKTPSKREQAVCMKCGETAEISAMIPADGRYICRDCAEHGGSTSE